MNNNNLAAYLLANIGNGVNQHIDLNIPADYTACKNVAFANLDQ